MFILHTVTVLVTLYIFVKNLTFKALNNCPFRLVSGLNSITCSGGSFSPEMTAANSAIIMFEYNYIMMFKYPLPTIMSQREFHVFSPTISMWI